MDIMSLAKKHYIMTKLLEIYRQTNVGFKTVFVRIHRYFLMANNEEMLLEADCVVMTVISKAKWGQLWECIV